jgi:hypothetical protein
MNDKSSHALESSCYRCIERTFAKFLFARVAADLEELKLLLARIYLAM